MSTQKGAALGLMLKILHAGPKKGGPPGSTIVKGYFVKHGFSSILQYTGAVKQLKTKMLFHFLCLQTKQY